MPRILFWVVHSEVKGETIEIANEIPGDDSLLSASKILSGIVSGGWSKVLQDLKRNQFLSGQN
jgi:hypothetical protein